MKILGIETSCDDTSVSLIAVANHRLKILAEVVSSQIKTHAMYGGVVPEVAARMHIENIIPVLRSVLPKNPEKYIDRISVTRGPGLVTSLLIGVETAKSLALAWQKPIVPVNHIEGHMLACWLGNKAIKLPAVALIVSGGHTEIILMKDFGQYKLIGQTQDDAAGEAFDKVAKLLKLGYPGGPIIQKLAESGNPKAFDLPRPMLDRKNFDFSFAGLKTAVLYLYQKGVVPKSKINDLCASFQQAAIDVLVAKTIVAARKYKVKTILLGGGVAANQPLRDSLSKEARRHGLAFAAPSLLHCADNATMIALAGYYGQPKPWSRIKADPNWELV
ncbi:MAG: tRNA (adenosine(37)-N6)-threonylcarbamoyltransferase complex transferase subunit TsaD [Patescibacteria group bacterium]|jgi:N6-L-threonylcarbamoyladenine synthase